MSEFRCQSRALLTLSTTPRRPGQLSPVSEPRSFVGDRAGAFSSNNCFRMFSQSRKVTNGLASLTVRQRPSQVVSHAFDCDNGLSDWQVGAELNSRGCESEETWSNSKRLYCCWRRSIGCPHSRTDPGMQLLILAAALVWIGANPL